MIRPFLMGSNLSDNKWLRIGTLCALYVAQGIPYGFVTIALAAYLAARGASTAEMGSILAMTSLPWTFKFLWGPLIDRFGIPAMGRRRPWILFAQTAMALTLGVMIFIPDLAARVPLVVALVCLINVFASLQDVAVDALAVDLLPPDERGRAVGLMYGASYGGAFVGGACIGWVIAGQGLRAGLIVQIALILGIMAVPLLIRERPGEKLMPWTAGEARSDVDHERATSSRKLISLLGRAFRARAAWLSAILALVSKAALGVSTTVIVVISVQELRWTEKFYAEVQGVAVWFGLCGSIFGGFLADKMGGARLAAAATVSLGAMWIVFGMIESSWADARIVSWMIWGEHLLFSVFVVSLFAVFMGVSWRAVAASQFTAYMALQNLSNTVGAKGAGALDAMLGSGQIYIALGAAQVAMSGLCFVIDGGGARSFFGKVWRGKTRQSRIQNEPSNAS